MELVDDDGFWTRRGSAEIDMILLVIGLGSGDGGPLDFALPSIASYRSTISDIEVRRLRGIGSSGGDKPGEGSELSSDFDGKRNID